MRWHEGIAILKIKNMIQVKNYNFYPDRMIFVPNSWGDEQLKKVFNCYPLLDDEAKTREQLFLHDASAVRVRPELLTHLGLSLSRNCNFRCRYCSACSTEGHVGNVPMQDVLVLVADIMKKWSVTRLIAKDSASRYEVYFTGGGEPTYDWAEFLNLTLAIEEKARSNQIPLQLGITTNGALSDEKADFLAGHFHRIMVSYDGLPNLQNKNRQSPHFSDSSSCVEHCIRRLCDKRAPLTIRTTVWLEDFSMMRKMADFLFGTFGCGFSWSILPVSPLGRAAKLYSGLDLENNENRFDFLEAYLDVVEYVAGKWPGGKVETQFFPASPSHVYCGSLAYAAPCAWLTSTGDIVTCIEADAFPTIIGSVNDGKVLYKDTCQDPLLKCTQQMFDSCKGCFAFPFCKGGCPARAITRERAHQKGMLPWECAMTVKFWRRLLDEVASGKEFFGWRAVQSRCSEQEMDGVFELVSTDVRKEDMLK